ncbi:hypothetical protein CLOM_g12266, partial [Closterium sp. NIES-68]
LARHPVQNPVRSLVRQAEPLSVYCRTPPPVSDPLASARSVLSCRSHAADCRSVPLRGRCYASCSSSSSSNGSSSSSSSSNGSSSSSSNGSSSSSNRNSVEGHGPRVPVNDVPRDVRTLGSSRHTGMRNSQWINQGSPGTGLPGTRLPDAAGSAI